MATLFSIVTTLLVLDIHLPRGFRPADDCELLQGFERLWQVEPVELPDRLTTQDICGRRD
jgi:hypothetical protein